jgi:hypothetical protein
MDSKSNSSSIFGNNRTLFKCVKNTLNRIFFHSEEETGTHLWLWGSRVEESWCGMCEPHFTHQIICFKGGFKIVQMDSQGASHEHVLWSLNNFAFGLEKVTPLESLEAKEVVVEVSGVVQLGVDLLSVLLHHSFQLGMDHACISSLLVHHRVQLLNYLQVIVICLLMEVRNFNS